MQEVAPDDSGEEILYEDKYVKVTNRRLVVYHYHFFLGLSKEIPLKKIRSVVMKDIDGWVKYRMWGMSWKHWWRWFHLDVSRHKKKKFIEIDLGKLVVPAITPEDPERVYQLLQELISGTVLIEKLVESNPLGLEE